ncbi:mechanosensitive ion channel [Pelagicoccus sp. NFK12]|uniref:Mechanosensitive ion channel n=1 Tax=Pelagicoccus enzymogenes TaxID=2773457 RepID=A0A927F6S5_9BACT|nr:mechanosensitive ion channel domain-containing protein [Pelagicoccus enzymogenes]MBD5778909.1 mechanosensitive ion channel [Pelagicoccus enzymogenes]MDQ8197347.1 mechanosensitive ion channel [Pelagicoccus enzymogenes]
MAQEEEASTSVASEVAESTSEFLGVDLNAIGEKITETVSLYGLSILAAIVIFVVGRFLANLVTKGLRGVMEKRNIDASLVGFATGLTHALLMTFVIIAALSRIGIQTTSLVAIIGAAGLAVGLALQGSLSNFAAGVLIIIFKPYRVGDYVVASGAEGVVEDIGIFTTTVVTLDHRTQIIPNSVATSGVIENYTKKGIRRLDIVPGVSYGDDIRKVKKVLEEIIAAEPRVLAEPKPFVGVAEMADSSVNFAFRPWVKVEDYWDLFFHFNEQIKIRFDEEDITIPFPQRDVHLFQEK